MMYVRSVGNIYHIVEDFNPKAELWTAACYKVLYASDSQEFDSERPELVCSVCIKAQAKNNPEGWKQAAQAIADEIVNLLARKQADYGHGNILAFGELGVLVRANDKVARLKNLQSKDAEVDETINDTWADLAGYAIIALMLRRGTFTQEL